MTYIDQMKYKDFISDLDLHIKNTQIINFEMIDAQCRGQPHTHSDKYYRLYLKNMLEKCLKKAVGTCLRSTKKDVFVEKKLASSHFLGKQNE